MSWNVRIIKHTRPKDDPLFEVGPVWYGVHEVYYNEKHQVWGWTTAPVHISGETEEDVKEYLRMIYRDAMSQSVLDKEKLPEGKAPFDKVLKKLKPRRKG